MKCEKNQFNCPVEATLSLIGGKYKPLILWHLIDQPLHYMELQRLIPNATPKMLSQQLHDLEDCGMIHREVIPEKPPKTIYSLTTFGQSIIPLLDAMCCHRHIYYLPHKPIPAPDHSFYVPISDLPSERIHHIRRRPALLRVRFPDCFVDLLFAKNPRWVLG